MDVFLSYTYQGLFLGAAYAIAASGLVLTYTTTRVFNLAHGATSMIMAYLYWEVHVNQGLPTGLSVALVLLVFAPLYGIVLERFVMRRVSDAPVSVTLVVTVGLFLILVGLAQKFWPDTKFYSVNPFFGYDHVSVLGVSVLWHYVLTVLVSVAVAAGLYVLLNRTRIGTAMRAATDNRELLQLFGARAQWVSMLSWALGSMLAALAGVLLVSYTGMDKYILTFLVIASFAAAMLGRLASLPLTYLGAIILGLAGAYVPGYIHGGELIQTGLQSSLPTFMLFLTLLFVPQVRLRVGQVKGILSANVPSPQRALVSAAVLVLFAMITVPIFGPTNLLRYGMAIAYAIVMLSLVLLTGYGGYVSLAQFTFVCVGAAVVAKFDTHVPVLLAILLAVVIAAAVGALVALPVLRLTGLYLALATLAFGALMDKLVFQADFMFGFGGKLSAKRVSLFGYDFNSTGAYVVLMVVVFALVGIGVLTVRRGAIGRLLIALRDSPAACGTLGLNQRWFRVALFSASAGIAGLAGALLAGLQGLVDPGDFVTLQSLPLLLVAVVAGVTSVTGALFGGVLLMLVVVLPTVSSTYTGLVFIVIGAGAILLANDPNGLINYFFKGLRLVEPRLPLPNRVRDLVGARAAELSVPDELPEEVDDAVPEREVAGHGVA